MSGENPNDEHKIMLMYTGVVINDIDPKKVARVRVKIPGLMDDSGWCFPMGAPGSGGHRRGFKSVPRVGAEVCIMFKQGNPDAPYYMPGNWGDTKKGLETPGGGRAPPLDRGLNLEGEVIDAENAKMIDVYESESFLISVDERTELDENTKGKGSLSIRHKLSGNTIEYDGISNAWLMQAELMSINVEGLLDINAGQVQINGRYVLTTGDPI